MEHSAGKAGLSVQQLSRTIQSALQKKTRTKNKRRKDETKAEIILLVTASTIKTTIKQRWCRFLIS